MVPDVEAAWAALEQATHNYAVASGIRKDVLFERWDEWKAAARGAMLAAFDAGYDCPASRFATERAKIQALAGGKESD